MYRNEENYISYEAKTAKTKQTCQADKNYVIQDKGLRMDGLTKSNRMLRFFGASPKFQRLQFCNDLINFKIAIL